MEHQILRIMKTFIHHPFTIYLAASLKTIKAISLIAALLFSQQVISQENNLALRNYWQIGLGLGELPMNGSFKPSISIGYHFNDKLYSGIIFQLKDKIQRDGSSFNAKSSELDGLASSAEAVSQRLMLQVRYTPVRRGPYLSGGFVFNGKDTETMVFDSRLRTLSGEDYHGSIEIQQTRPAGWGLALGIGYQYDFKNGLSAGFEWTPAWGQYPTPSYAFGGTANLDEQAVIGLQKKMDKGFKSSVTNMYKVFHLGLAYRFK